MNCSLRPWRALLPLICALLMWLPTGNAQATVSCTATMDNVSFGSVDLVNGTGLTASTTLHYTCTNNGLVPAYAYVCFNIGDGAQGNNYFNPRVMTSSTDVLQFQLYQPNSVIWGSNGNSVVPYPFTASMQIPAWSLSSGNGSISGTATMNGKLLSGPSTTPPGSYQDNFPGNHTSILLTENPLSMPTTCGTKSGSFPFTVSATVIKGCSVSTGNNLNFGTVDGLATTGNTDQLTTISVTCSKPTPYTVALIPSNSDTGGAGMMSGTGTNTDKVPYRLYQDAARTTNVWGNIVGSNTVANTGTGLVQSLTVYGRVPSAHFTPDSYSDTVTVNVAY